MQHPWEHWDKFCSGVSRGSIADELHEPGNNEKRASILNMRFRGRNKHDETNNGDNAEKNHGGSSFFGFIGKVPSRDGDEAAKEIRGYSHKLRLIVRISHIRDDSREE
jgi:hypothetical protein